MADLFPDKYPHLVTINSSCFQKINRIFKKSYNLFEIIISCSLCHIMNHFRRVAARFPTDGPLFSTKPFCIVVEG